MLSPWLHCTGVTQMSPNLHFILMGFFENILILPAQHQRTFNPLLHKLLRHLPLSERTAKPAEAKKKKVTAEEGLKRSMGWRRDCLLSLK